MVLKLYGLKCIMIVIPIYCVESFIEYLSSVADRINQENITCTIMGDFNIDLLKLEPHLATDRLNSLILWVLTFSSPIYCSQQESQIIQ